MFSKNRDRLLTSEGGTAVCRQGEQAGEEKQKGNSRRIIVGADKDYDTKLTIAA